MEPGGRPLRRENSRAEQSRQRAGGRGGEQRRAVQSRGEGSRAKLGRAASVTERRLYVGYSEGYTSPRRPQRLGGAAAGGRGMDAVAIQYS